MLPVSFEYAAFLVALVLVYWRLSLKFQNLLLLFASFAFFYLWDWRSLLVVVVSGTAEWGLGLALARPAVASRRPRKLALLWVSVVLNVLTLCVLKYFNFFIESAEPLLRLLSPDSGGPGVGWIVPIGISFWTLQKMSHTFDVYFGAREPCASWTRFLIFVSFFPTALSGPIEKSRSFLPQLETRRVWKRETLDRGAWLLGLGLFKKVFLAEACHLIGEEIEALQPAGALVWVQVWFYAIELYSDFSGYSDMARGSALLLGLEISQNFFAPYFTGNLSEYWQNWHASLYAWLNAYVFTPANMTFRRLGMGGLLLAIWITFILSGLWHGFGWTYLAWGAVHGAGMSVYSLTQGPRKKIKKRFGQPLWLRAGAIFLTFNWVCLGYLFFNAASMDHAWTALGNLFAGPFSHPELPGYAGSLAFFAAIAFFLQWMERDQNNVFWIFSLSTARRTIVYFIMYLFIMRFHAQSVRFIYTQF